MSGWFVDDGLALVRPALFDSWVCALDIALLSFGATRGTLAQGNVKSSARFPGLPELRHEFQGWDTPHVRRTVQVLNPDDNTSALGAPSGPLNHNNTHLQDSASVLHYAEKDPQSDG